MNKTVKTFLAFSLIILFTNQGFAQNEMCSCETDLKFLNEKIRKTPSYKNNKANYDTIYSKTTKKAETLNSGYDCFVLLNKLLIALNDNHSKIYGINKGAIEEVRNDEIKFNAFKESALFTCYPRPKIDLDSLQRELSSKSNEAVEGIYTRGNLLTIGVFKNGIDNDYHAIVLNSESQVWEAGEIIYTLVPYGNNYLLTIGGGIESKRLVAYTERIENGFFLMMGFQKDGTQTNFSNSKYPDSTYVRKELSPETTYLKAGSFNSFYPTLSQAESFYKSLEGNLTTKNLILDLRDNGGGGVRNSGILFRIIRDYLKNNKVYLLINHRTASNAEQFVYRLSRFDNCFTFGNRTNGTAAYELEGKNYNLPCGNFVAVLTSKKHSNYIKIESQGIEPMIKLNMETDWLIELLKFIQEEKKG